MMSSGWQTGKPSRMAPDLPMKRYRTPCRSKTSRISSAWRYSNAAITQPGRQVLFAPAPVLFHRVEGPVGHIVQDRLVGANERVAEPRLQRPACRRLEFLQPLARDGVAFGEVLCGPGTRGNLRVHRS